MRPNPVTKPSPAGRCSSMPKSVQRWRMNLSSSSKEFSSRSKWMRSRAVSLPALCSRSRRSGPPPASASASSLRSSSMRSWCLESDCETRLGSGNGTSGRRRFLDAENAHGEMRGQPDSAEEENHAEKQLGGDGNGALERRFDGGDVNRGADEGEHGGESHRHDEDGGQNGSEDSFHGNRGRRIAQWRGNQNVLDDG